MRKRFYHAYIKCTDFSLPGLVYMPYIMAETTQVICDSNFEPKKLLASRYALTTVNRNNFGSIISENESQNNL